MRRDNISLRMGLAALGEMRSASERDHTEIGKLLRAAMAPAPAAETATAVAAKGGGDAAPLFSLPMAGGQGGVRRMGGFPEKQCVCTSRTACC